MGIITEDLVKLAASFLAGGVASYLALNLVFSNKEQPPTPSLLKKEKEDQVNHKIEKEKSKVVHSFDIEDLPDKVAYCRCWKSSKFPYCDGTHNAHNKMTGDNVGPLCLQRKSN